MNVYQDCYQEKKWQSFTCSMYEAAPLYVPQGVEMGGGGSPLKNWLDTAGWPEPITDIQCKGHPKHV